MMEVNEILNFIASNGFAIVIAVYFIVNNNKSMQAMNETLIELKTLIQTLAEDKDKEKED